MTKKPAPSLMIETGMLLGECPLWDHRTQEMLWIDIEGKRFFRRTAKEELSDFSLPEQPGSFALTEMPGIYIGAFESGFARFDPARGSFDVLSDGVPGDGALRMNDGRTDRNGIFWAGSMARDGASPKGDLWKFAGSGRAEKKISGIFIPNSLCWSLDGRIMYFADGPRNTIWRYEFGPETGLLGEPEIFATTPGHVHPDGSCIDSEDHLWNAQWGAGQVVRYRPDGSVDKVLDLPVSQPSCVCFGGENLDMLMITSARTGLSEAQLEKEPLAGALLVYEPGGKGVPETICRTAL